MANIYPPTYPQHHPLDFHPRPVSHSPSPLAFGFGLAGASPTSSSFSPHNHQVAPRPQKRRIELEDDDRGRRGDDAMDRSPTPERPKRGPLKRLRIAASEASTKGSGNDREANEGKESKSSSPDIDVGVLLASLPQQSLLPLMMALLRKQPDLKPLVLSLLPRPTLETALEALAQASKTLREAYPYSAPSGAPSSSLTFGGGGSTFTSRPLNSSPGSFGRGLAQVTSSHINDNQNHGGMRESYIISRLRPHISEFVSACLSYLPYFSYLPPPSNSSQPHVSAIKPPPAETFTFLSAVTTHLFSQPQLTRLELSSLLKPRLMQEWKAWVDRVDEVVNKQGGMFSGEVARGWERSLDDFADRGGSEMKEVRDIWVTKVGWLVSRRAVFKMDEDEEL
ncbi:hypothetical protein K439DRAFT_1652317 [Ramaria rubella]|nr:hypothetical protein K439DRAFT_1652317 [Ramaria rubella]